MSGTLVENGILIGDRKSQKVWSALGEFKLKSLDAFRLTLLTLDLYLITQQSK